MKVLTHIRIDGLLGQFDHEIRFPAEADFVILHGPNGVGKTRLLELVGDVLGGKSPNRRTPFRQIYVAFSDGSWIEVERQGERTSWRTSKEPEKVHAPQDSDERALNLAARDLMEQGLIRRLPGVGAAGYRFRDAESSEEISAQEAVDRYMDDVDPEKLPVPKIVLEFTKGLTASLVEVNRLKSFQEQRQDPSFRVRDQRVTVAAADHYAKDLAKRITLARSSHAVFAQKLDGTYPRRLLSGKSNEATHEQVARLQEDLQALSKRLERAALLESGTSLTAIGVDEVTEPWKLSALRLHYEDSIDKLRELSPLADRILLFHELIADKLVGKEMSITSEEGYSVATQAGPLPPSHLSSGEQHEIVMTYRLIFESQPQQLVMIDEPEVSLHVKWQRSFLDDLSKIAELDGLRFIVATHSPQIVGGWTSRMVALGDAQQ